MCVVCILGGGVCVCVHHSNNHAHFGDAFLFHFNVCTSRILVVQLVFKFVPLFVVCVDLKFFLLWVSPYRQLCRLVFIQRKISGAFLSLSFACCFCLEGYRYLCLFNKTASLLSISYCNVHIIIVLFFLFWLKNLIFSQNFNFYKITNSCTYVHVNIK